MSPLDSCQLTLQVAMRITAQVAPFAVPFAVAAWLLLRKPGL